MEQIITTTPAIVSDDAVKTAFESALLAYGASALAEDLTRKVGKDSETRHEALKEVCVVLGVTVNSWKPAIVANPAVKTAEESFSSLSRALMAAVMSEDESEQAKVNDLRPKVKAAKLHLEECKKNSGDARTLSSLMLRCNNTGEKKNGGPGDYQFGATRIKQARSETFESAVRLLEKAASKGVNVGTYADALSAALANKELLDTLTEEDLTPRQYEAYAASVKDIKKKLAEAKLTSDAELIKTLTEELHSATENVKSLQKAYDKYAAKRDKAAATATLAETKTAFDKLTNELAETSEGTEVHKTVTESLANAKMAYSKAIDTAKKFGIPTEEANTTQN